MKKFALLCSIVLIIATITELGLRAVYYQLAKDKFATVRALEILSNVTLSRQMNIDIPKEIYNDLNASRAVIENSGNPTNVKRIEKPISRRSENLILGYELRPNVTVTAHLFEASERGNIDPPVIAYSEISRPSETTVNWLNENALLTYAYSTDSMGNRRTLPNISADQKVFVLGDSVAFGVGVNDQHTFASLLQSRMGNTYEVINLGVGGYGAAQILERARLIETVESRDVIIFVACQNDFHDNVFGFDEEKLTDFMNEVSYLKENKNFAEVFVVLQTYQEYSFSNFWTVWPDKFITNMTSGIQKFERLGSDLGLKTVNWDRVVNQFNAEQGSIFAGISLYFDHNHLSPLGNDVLARIIVQQLSTLSK